MMSSVLDRLLGSNLLGDHFLSMSRLRCKFIIIIVVVVTITIRSWLRLIKAGSFIIIVTMLFRVAFLNYHCWLDLKTIMWHIFKRSR